MTTFTRYFVMLMSLMLCSVVHAVEVKSTVDSEGWIVVSATLPHTKDRVDSFLSSSFKTMKLGDGIRKVETEPMANGCTKMHVTNNGFAKTLSYISIRCPIPGGWHSKMISSDDFDQHDIQWLSASAGNNATEVRIRVRVSLKAPIPEFIVRTMVTKGLTQTLTRLDGKLAGDGLAPAAD